MASKKKTPASPSKEGAAPVAKKAAKVKTYEQGVEDGIRQTEKTLEKFFKKEIKAINQYIKGEMKELRPDFAGLIEAKSEESVYEFLKDALEDGWLLKEQTT